MHTAKSLHIRYTEHTRYIADTHRTLITSADILIHEHISTSILTLGQSNQYFSLYPMQYEYIVRLVENYILMFNFFKKHFECLRINLFYRFNYAGPLARLSAHFSPAFCSIMLREGIKPLNIVKDPYYL